MVWTAPKTWASGDVLTAADMNTYVRDNTDFIMNTAMKKIATTTATYAGLITVGGSEVTVTTMAITDPLFPSTSYAYIAFGALVGGNNSGVGDVVVNVRDNGTAGTIIGVARSTPAAAARRVTYSVVSNPITVASGARTVFWRGQMGSGQTIDMNDLNLTTYLGAVLAPI